MGKKIGFFCHGWPWDVMRISKYLSLKILKINILITNRLRPCALVYIFIFLGDLNFHISKHVSCVSHEWLCPMKTEEMCYGIRCVMICYNVVKCLFVWQRFAFWSNWPRYSISAIGPIWNTRANKIKYPTSPIQ